MLLAFIDVAICYKDTYLIGRIVLTIVLLSPKVNRIGRLKGWLFTIPDGECSVAEFKVIPGPQVTISVTEA